MRKLIFILLSGIVQLCWAQDPQLLDNEWILSKLAIDGEDIFPPSQVAVGDLNFFEDTMVIDLPNCDELWSTFTSYTSDDSFENEDGGVALQGDCGNPDYSEFKDQHYSIYFDLETEFAKNPFQYEINQNGDELSLIVTNSEGDQALYGSQNLSVDDNLLHEFSVYPNPTSNLLKVESSENIEDFSIVDYQGRRIDVMPIKDHQIDLSGLKPGVYFLLAEINDKVLIKKVVKE